MMREIEEYGNYFQDFCRSLDPAAVRKIDYVTSLLSIRKILSKKHVKKIRKELYELRIQYKANSYRIFFIFERDNRIILLNGFLKKTQKTPENEINKALKLKDEYYGRMEIGRRQ